MSGDAMNESLQHGADVSAGDTSGDVSQSDTRPARQATLPVRIEVGKTYVWEPDDPKAIEVTTVTRIVVMENGDVRVWSTSRRGGETWNDADRFQEACRYA